MASELVPRQDYALSLEEMTGNVAKIQEVMRSLMKEETHYGIIPGTPKPTLYKPGAEMLGMVFRLAPHFEHTREWDGPHLTVYARCSLVHIPTGVSWGTGEGSCSTKESKYAWRGGKRVCPKCGADAIIKGKAEYGGGFLCFAKKGGCGAKFKDNDKAITEQTIERVPNPDIADQYNTVLKMANKRAHVAATLVVTAASDMFTQDIEDLPEFAERVERNVTPQKQPTDSDLRRTTDYYNDEEMPERPADLISGGAPRKPATKDPALSILESKPVRSRWECHPRLLAACKERAAEIGNGDKHAQTKAGSRLGDAIEAVYGPLPDIAEGDALEGAIEMAADFER